MGDLRVAMIGLGRMGGPIADHVASTFDRVRVYDVAPGAVAARAASGGVASASPADAARDADVVGVVVFDDEQVRSVVSGSGGLLSVLGPGAVIAIHTTVSLETVHELAAAAEERGVHLLDAGISGGEAGARAGTLVTMVGGAAAAVDRARPVFASFSSRVIHAGPLGAGMALKLARNAVGYLMMAAVHEGMVLSHASGVDLAVLEQVLHDTAVDRQGFAPFAFGGPGPVAGGEDEEFLRHTLRLAEKDLDQTLALARALSLEVPQIAVARANFDAVMRLRGAGS